MDSPYDAVRAAFKDLDEAHMRFDSAEENYRLASREKTDALNNLNEVGKRLDQTLNELTHSLPNECDLNPKRRMNEARCAS